MENHKEPQYLDLPHALIALVILCAVMYDIMFNMAK